jgi:hypothetical protein
MGPLEEKHKNLINNYKDIKSKHLEKLGTRMLKNEEKFHRLKEKKFNANFLNKF